MYSVVIAYCLPVPNANSPSSAPVKLLIIIINYSFTWLPNAIKYFQILVIKAEYVSVNN